MVVDERELRDDLTQEEWLNAIRNNASLDYRARIPEATQANIQDTIQKLISNRPLMNEAVNVLVNRIGAVIYAQNLSFENPLGRFKRESLTYGDTIEEIMVGLLVAQEYDGMRDDLEKEVFGAMTPEVQASYHRVNRRNKYKLTVREPQLRQAFLSENGVSRFIMNLMKSQQTSDSYDEFLAMMNLFNEYEKNDGFFKVQIPDLADVASDSADAKFALRRFREMSTELMFPNRAYNAAHMPSTARTNELELFINPQAESAIDVEALAGAFNMERAEFKFRKTSIPQRYFNITGAQAILTTPDFFVVADQLLETTDIFNPSSLIRNFWLHHWQAVSASRFAPAILFTTEAGDVITISDEPVASVTAITVKDGEGTVQATNVERGKLYTVEANAVTNPAGGYNDAVVYELAGAKSLHTLITQNGVLYVGLDESAETLTINIKAVGDNTITGTTTRTVVGDLVTVWPNANVELDSDNDGIPDSEEV